MSQPDLYSLQTRLERELLALANAQGFALPVREVSVYEAPFYNPGNPLPAVHLAGDRIEFWLHDDGASYRVVDKSDYFEQLDYETQDALVHAFLAQVATLLESAR